MTDYIVQTGPLKTFDGLFDPRLEKLRGVADCHTIQIAPRRVTQRRVIAQLNRPVESELRFVQFFFSAITADHRTIFGIRDVTGGKAGQLAAALLKHGKLRYFEGEYGVSEDEMTVVEFQNFDADFHLIQKFVPPSAGAIFFYLTWGKIDLFEIYWLRAARSSLKSQVDRFRQDVLAHANEAKVSLIHESDGSFTLALHPKVETDPIQEAIAAAGRKAGMDISFAPGLFG